MKILIISPQTWTNHFISKQYYAIHLKKMGHDVFFLNPLSTGLGKKLTTFKIKKEKNFGIKIIDVSILFPLSLKTNIYFLFQLFQKLSFFIINYRAKLNFDLIWSFDENNLDIIDYFESKKKIIQIMDPIKNEIKFTKKSSKFDLAIFISEVLKVKNFAKKNLIIPHGLNLFFVKKKFKFYRKKNLNKIGLYGNFLSGRFDLKKIKYIVNKNKDIIFTFIGSIDSQHPYKNLSSFDENKKIINDLIKKENVKFLQNIEVQKLPSVIEKQDLFLTILKEKYNVNAHKLLEIISSGKPMISSYFDFYKNSSNLIYFPKNNSKEEFHALIKKIVTNYERFFNKTLFNTRKKYSLKFNYNIHIKKIFDEIY